MSDLLQPAVWHYVGFGITHAGCREECETCVVSRAMAVDAWNNEHFWFGVTP